jgi:structural maintenance of chromosome 1
MDHEQNDEIRRQSSERFSIYRRCKVEDIELPLESGSLKNVPLEEVSAVDGHQLVRIRSKFSHLSDLTEQNLQDDEVNDYEIVVDFESLEDDDREVGDRFIPSSSCQTLTAKCFLQNGNPERGHDFEQRIAALASDIEKMAPNLKAIEKCVRIWAIQVQVELISSCTQADRRGGKAERYGKRQ